MKITEITVECHEKRNHPHEYGHADASVRLTAVLTNETEYSAQREIDRLQGIARNHVQSELDAWIDGIKEQRRIDGLVNEITYKLRNMHGSNRIRYAKEALAIIRELPVDLRTDQRKRLRERLDATRPKPEPEKSSSNECTNCGKKVDSGSGFWHGEDFFCSERCADVYLAYPDEEEEHEQESDGTGIPF